MFSSVFTHHDPFGGRFWLPKLYPANAHSCRVVYTALNPPNAFNYCDRELDSVKQTSQIYIEIFFLKKRPMCNSAGLVT